VNRLDELLASEFPIGKRTVSFENGLFLRGQRCCISCQFFSKWDETGRRILLAGDRFLQCVR
jgi:hypothetical protein